MYHGQSNITIEKIQKHSDIKVKDVSTNPLYG